MLKSSPKSAAPSPAFLSRIFASFIFLLLFLPSPLPAQVADSSAGALAQKIQEVISQEGADRGFWGIEIYAPARGRVLYALNENRNFTPASLTKLFTTAAALDLVGPDFQFHTVVGTRGRIDRHGRLLGSLFLVGAGDPDLAGCDVPFAPGRDEDRACDPMPVLDQLAAQVADRGVRSVTDDLVLDQSLFSIEPYPPGWAVGDLLWSYGAPARALSLADNTVKVTVGPGDQPGDPAVVTLEPYTHIYQIENRVRTTPAGGETLLFVRRDPGSRVLSLTGAVALDNSGRSMKVAIEEPSDFVGDLFRRALEQHGIRVEGTLRVDYAPPAPLVREAASFLPVALAEHVSPPLVEYVKLINKESQNLHAEMLLRLLGQQQPPATAAAPPPRGPFEPPARRGDGSTQAGLEVVRAWLANAGVDPNQVELRDGSGLSRRNLVTPDAVVSLLRYVETRPWAPLFRDSLAVGGEDGTMEKRMLDSVARGRVRAKTGSLANNNSLAGYVQTRSGETLLFAFFLNHHLLDNGRAVQLLDRLCELLVDFPPASATD